MNRRVIILLSFVGSLVFSAAAFAGFKYTPSYSVSSSGGYANGMLAAIRANATTTDYLGCQTWADASGDHGSCFAVTAHDSGGCSTSDPRMVAAIRSLGGDSYVSVYWNPASGVCTSLLTSVSSSFQPKAL